MFKQTVVPGYPPIIWDIKEVLPWAMNPGVLFSWGDKIYNPSGINIHPALLVHEAVHGERQTDVIDWWARYLVHPSFRFEEEKLAHIAEYQWWCDHGNRHERRAFLELIAKRLASPLYGSVITRAKAITLLRKNTHDRTNPA